MSERELLIEKLISKCSTAIFAGLRAQKFLQEIQDIAHKIIDMDEDGEPDNVKTRS